MRIIGVWLAALTAVSLAMGRLQAFWFIFAIYGIALTLPALFILCAVSEAERRLLRAGRPLLALSVGLAFGLLLPPILYWMAASKENVADTMPFYIALCVGTGLLWSLTALPRVRRAGRTQAR